MTTRYTKEHEYIRVEDNNAIVGITDFAQSQLGDVVFVELPAVGTVLKKGAEAAVIESVKAASEIFSPVGGEVIEVNTSLAETPGLINEDPNGKGWVLILKLSDPSEFESLMDEKAYQDFLTSLE
jgi:glycine cleavage system H protein